MLEACSVCTCNKDEIPQPWIAGKKGTYADEYGWISSDDTPFGFETKEQDQSLGEVAFSSDAAVQPASVSKDYFGSYQELHQAQKGSNSYLSFLHHTEDFTDNDDWTHLHTPSESGVYVNLLENPERYTGYAGEASHRVWRAIKEENCFGGIDDTCLEKRVFHRVISGLQASITTHIAKAFKFPNGEWGYNIPLYWRAVGDYPERVNNMYLAFLFLLRATMKAKHVLAQYPYQTGNATDDAYVQSLMESLVFNGNSTHLNNFPLNMDSSLAVNECSSGFNESVMFQVPSYAIGPQYWQILEEKHMLREEFRQK